MKTLAFAATALALLTVSASAQEEPVAAPGINTVSASLNLSLDSATDIERKTVEYHCSEELNFSVQYINAAPNFLAVVPVDGVGHLFVTTISGSGARYVAGPYEWWEKGDEATLRDLMQDENAEPLATCTATSGPP